MEGSDSRLEGWLLKQGARGVVKGWKKRWFSQVGYKLFYYDQKPDWKVLATGQEKGFIDLNTMSKVVARSNTTRFEIHTPKRIYILEALKTEDQQFWVRGLNSYLRNIRQRSSTWTTIAMFREEITNTTGYQFANSGPRPFLAETASTMPSGTMSTILPQPIASEDSDSDAPAAPPLLPFASLRCMPKVTPHGMKPPPHSTILAGPISPSLSPSSSREVEVEKSPNSFTRARNKTSACSGEVLVEVETEVDPSSNRSPPLARPVPPSRPPPAIASMFTEAPPPDATGPIIPTYSASKMKRVSTVKYPTITYSAWERSRLSGEETVNLLDRITVLEADLQEARDEIANKDMLIKELQEEVASLKKELGGIRSHRRGPSYSEDQQQQQQQQGGIRSHRRGPSYSEDKQQQQQQQQQQLQQQQQQQPQVPFRPVPPPKPGMVSLPGISNDSFRRELQQRQQQQSSYYQDYEE